MRKIAIFLFLTIFQIQLVLAEAPDVLNISINQAVKYALQSSEDALMAKFSVDKSKARYMEVHALTYPQLTGNLGWRRFFELPQSLKSAGYLDYQFQAEALLTQVVWAFGKVSTAVDIAEDYLNVESDNLRLTREEVGYGAKRLYYAVVFASKALKIAQESYKNALANQKILESRFRMGRVSRIDNIKMAADVAMREPEVLNAEREFGILLRDFKTFTHISEKKEVLLIDDFRTDFPEFSYEKLLAEMERNEPSLKLLRNTVNLSRNVARLKKRQPLPELGAYGSYSYGGMSGRAFPEGRQMDSTVSAGLNLSLTLWDSFASRGAYQQALGDVSIADLNYQKRYRELENNLKKTVEDYNAYRRIYASNKRALEIAQESYKIAQSSLSSGAATLAQVNDAELQQTAAKLRLTGSLYSLNVLMVEIDRLYGRSVIQK